jgi:hypothetical protein
MLADYIVDYEIGLTNVYQQNVRGGISTHRGEGELTGMGRMYRMFPTTKQEDEETRGGKKGT